MDSKSFYATNMKRNKRNCSMRNLAHGEACHECTSNCMTLHWNQVDPSSSVERFFKIMLGTDFSEVMFVPFIVAREKKWRKYINREACLEDTNGEKYPVKISEVDNAVAFKEGWCRFSSDHHLEEGDFLIFNHLRHGENLHFIVHIYGKSGKEKVFFSRGHDKKVSTTNRNAALLDKTLEADIRSSGRKKNPSPSVVPKPLSSNIHHDTTTTKISSDYTDAKMLQQPEPAPWDAEPLYMLPRHDICLEDRTSLYDLWSLENNVHAGAAVLSIGNDESGTTNHTEEIIISTREPDLLETFPVKRKASSPEPQPYKKQNALIENTIESAAVDVAPKCQRDSDIQNTFPVKIKFSSPEPQPCKNQSDIIEKTIKSAPVKVALAKNMAVNVAERPSTHVPKTIECGDRFGSADSIPVQRDVAVPKMPSYVAKPYSMKNTGVAIKTVKNELDIEDEPFYHQQSLNVKEKNISNEQVRRYSSNMKKDVRIPKTEPFCLEDRSASFLGRESSSAEVDDKPYLLLQSELSSVLSRGKKLRIIYLRGPDGKVWPVTYMKKTSVRVLTSGWKHFKAMYNLRPGYRCRIELEDASKRIYRFGTSQIG